MRGVVLLIIGALAATLVLATACGGGEPLPTQPPASIPTTAPPTAVPLPTLQVGDQAPAPPHAFAGKAMVDGKAAPDGTVVTAWFDGVSQPVAEGAVANGVYNLKIVQRGDASYANKKVTFKIDGQDAKESSTWESGAADELNLSAGGGGAAPPVVSPTGGPLQITTEGDALKFNLSQLTVKAGSEVVITFKNASTVNQHNFVVVQAGTKDEVAAAGTGAGPDNAWIPQDDDRVIAHSQLLDPGASEDIRFTAPGPGNYQFVCTFPGHNFTMFGEFKVTP